MSHKLKSSLYFATLVLALISYYNMDQAKQNEEQKLVENTLEQASVSEVIN